MRTHTYKIRTFRRLSMALQKPDKSIRHLRGIIEDVLVKVDKFIFPVDFVILNLDDKVKIPLFLGWQLLATSQTLIDVKNGRMVLMVSKKKVAFKLQDAMRHLMDFVDSCYFVNLINECVTDFVQVSLLKDTTNEILEEETHGEIASMSDKHKNKVKLTP